MMQIEGDFNYYGNQEIQIVDLPYGKGNFSMAVILPRKSNQIDELINDIDKFQWQNYLDAMDTSTVLLQLPKFKLEYKLTLNEALKNLGMGIAFSPGQADFSRIVDGVSLFISKVLHKTFVQVDEEGTEAAAVTVVEIRYTSVEPRSTLMQVDHPFMFVLHEKQTGTILFMGKIMNPEWHE
jgi:serpin B